MPALFIIKRHRATFRQSASWPIGTEGAAQRLEIAGANARQFVTLRVVYDRRKPNREWERGTIQRKES
jgi:hypothetical protein